MNEKEKQITCTHEELEQASQPLRELLNKYYHPHCYVIVTQDGVEVTEGVMFSPFKEQIK